MFIANLRGSVNRVLGLQRPWHKRIRVVTQLNPFECGIACLVMILEHYQISVTITQVRRRLVAGRNGTTAKAIAQAARSFGLQVNAFSLNVDQLHLLSLPAIAHWNNNHFVVIESIEGNFVRVVDPALGRRRMLVDEFDDGFSNVALTFQSSSEQAPSLEKIYSSRDYIKDVISRIPAISAVKIFIASLVLLFIGLAVPWTTKFVVDNYLSQNANDITMTLGLGIIVTILILAFINYIRAATLVYLQIALDKDMTAGFVTHLLSLPFRFFQQRSSGELLNRLGSIFVIRETLSGQSLTLLLDGIFLTIYLGILFVQDRFYFISVLIIALVQLLTLLFSSSRIHRLTQGELEAQSAMQSYIVEVVRGIGALKASASEGRALKHWSELYAQQLSISQKKGLFMSFVTTIITTLNTLAPLFLLWLGIQRVSDGAFSLGTMLALNALAVLVLVPLGSIVNNVQQLQLVGANIDRVVDIFAEEPEDVQSAKKDITFLNGKIEVQNVSFRFAPDDKPILHHVNLIVEPGEKVAIVGATGSGKTTLGLLLLGLYKPEYGTIMYDDNEIDSLDINQLRGKFGVVFQEPQLFTGSIYQNIAFNNPNITIEQVHKAARLAHIHDEVCSLPLGYHTPVLEGGIGFSGGQRQRIALARALVVNPRVLLLDEATSHLDVATERQIDQNLSHLNCTRLIIAHRLSTIENADRIFLLNDTTLSEVNIADVIGFFEEQKQSW